MPQLSNKIMEQKYHYVLFGFYYYYYFFFEGGLDFKFVLFVCILHVNLNTSGKT